MTGAELAQYQADQAAAAAALAAPPAPAVLAAIPAAMVAENLAASFTSTDEVTTVAEQLHAAARQGIANFKADISAWPTLTDGQKLEHVLGLMQAMVGVLQHATGDYS
jgi:murein L,D-transpeptidase YcbB/YkuD